MKWKSPLVDEPEDNVTYWVRVYYWDVTPIKAKYLKATKEWVIEDKNIYFPVWVVSRYREI